jgi:acyl transferase domain-containing protein
MVVLKRLNDAIEAGDHIRAVIRNTGVNQDGKTLGIALPSRDAQQNLIRSVYQQAGLDPQHTAYVEAHGTGTIVGDAEELGAIRGAFGSEGSQVAHLHIGSIKTNIGHLENASGVAGFIKSVLMVEHGMIPPVTNLQKLKDNLNLDGSRIIVCCCYHPSAPELMPHRYLVN